MLPRPAPRLSVPAPLRHRWRVLGVSRLPAAAATGGTGGRGAGSWSDLVVWRKRKGRRVTAWRARRVASRPARSEEHTSELQSLMRISYDVFCLQKKKHNT